MAINENAPLHILTLTPFYPTEQDDARGCFVAEPLRALAARGVRNSVLAVEHLYRAGSKTAASAPAAEWVRFPSIPGRWGLSTSGAFLFAAISVQVGRLHRRTPVDVIHAHGPLPCGHAAMLLARKLGIPFVVSVHGLDAYSTRQVAGAAGKWCRCITHSIFESARSILCVSDHVRQKVIAGGPDFRTAVVYNSADLTCFYPEPEPTAANTKILSVGNLTTIKGHASLLRALSELAGSSPSQTCDIIGDGPERPRLERMAADLGLGERVRFLGRQPRAEVAKALRSASLFVLPSSYEALGCVYLEAMASEVVAIGCRGQGIEEVIEHGRNGWLVGTENVKELVDGMATLLPNDSLRRQIGKQGRLTILQGFTLEHQAERLLASYRECTAA